ncbi:SDR family NAD(P)-dependent oxidoreductase [Pseudonocardia spinosispora]|uniref:SDR family NAD(P)-dependent oxidoreductase n=1 Tax=Pseudonocardia spinosispora TaxID=103441 RepID=UPI0003FD4195|nr:SDR family NAD(P)-dependent oxidoreductase [Pseudonocardia spinosispora]
MNGEDRSRTGALVSGDAGIAVVTGGARNLGRAIALALAGAGFGVVVNTRADLAAAEQVASAARELGVPARAVRADVTDPAEVAAMMTVAAELGPLRVVVNNAALRTRVPVGELTIADWRAVHAVILDGAFHCVQAALPALRAAGHGRILSILGANALRGDPGRVHVSAAKHGLVGMTKALAAACAPDGITANAVSPGRINDPDPAEERRHRDRLAALVTFLASPAAAEITGQLIESGPPPG